MAEFKSDLMQTLEARSFVHQCTDAQALDARAAQGRIVAYIGYDCTATSLHIGSLITIMMLHWLQRCGHKPIVLMGGGTTQVGDPSGRDESRRLLTKAEIQANMDGIKRVFSRYLKFGDGPTDAIMVDNAEWLEGLQYIAFLRDYGRHFSVNRMLSFDSVKLRLEREQPLTFLEFNYMILQAYDFLELSRRQKCDLQMGGSDQWGNIVNGVDLGRRVDNRALFGLTCPLLATSSGAKMGKTASGAVWLNDDMMSAYGFWQHWRNTEDGDVGRFLRLFTELPINEIARLERLAGADINEAKKILATEVTRLCRGDAAASEAADTARRTFEEGQSAEKLPTITLSRAQLDKGVAVADLLVRAGMASSKAEARRLIKGGGARLNDKPVSDEAAQLRSADLAGDGVVKISAGRKRHALIKKG